MHACTHETTHFRMFIYMPAIGTMPPPPRCLPACQGAGGAEPRGPASQKDVEHNKVMMSELTNTRQVSLIRLLRLRRD